MAQSKYPKEEEFEDIHEFKLFKSDEISLLNPGSDVPSGWSKMTFRQFYENQDVTLAQLTMSKSYRLADGCIAGSGRYTKIDYDLYDHIIIVNHVPKKGVK